MAVTNVISPLQGLGILLLIFTQGVVPGYLISPLRG